MQKAVIVCMAVVTVAVFASRSLFAMSCHGGSMSHAAGGHEEKTSAGKKPGIESYTGTVYVCPMHPEVRSDDPGACPQCGMTLEAKQVTRYRVKNSLPEAAKTDTGKVVKKDQTGETLSPPTDKKDAQHAQCRSGAAGCPLCDKGQTHKAKDGNVSGSTAQSKDNAPVYGCPMHPEIRSDKPGKCPECGMRLEKQEE